MYLPAVLALTMKVCIYLIACLEEVLIACLFVVLDQTNSGGALVNDTLMHLVIHNDATDNQNDHFDLMFCKQ